MGTTTTSLENLRSRVAEAPRNRRQRIYDDALKAELLSYARGRVAQGLAVAPVAREIGLSLHTLYGWLTAPAAMPASKQPVRRAAALRPVQVVEPVKAPRAERDSRAVIVLATGIRIEGVRLGDIARLVKELS
jgi:hypothetical protein